MIERADDDVHRQSNRSGDESGVKIVREVPLWGILTALTIVAVQAIAMYVKQEKQADVQESQAKVQLLIQEQLVKLASEIGSKNLKDVEHDLKLGDLERRMQIVEGRERARLERATNGR